MSDNRATLELRVVHDLRKRSIPGLFFFVVVTIIVLFANRFYSRHMGFSMRFFSSIMGICLFRFIHLALFKWVSKSHGALNQSIFSTSIVATAMIWGTFFARFMTLEGEDPTILLMAICTIGLSAGGAVAYLPSLRLSVAYNLCTLMPAIATMVVQRINLPLVLLMFMFSAYLVLMARRANQEYRQALENEFLLVEKSEALNTLSRIDALTGLYNRRHFGERIDHELKRSTRVQMPAALILCDIDHFKLINDRYGHQAGDEFLKLTAGILQKVFKRDSDLVSRYGGEEFVVLLCDTPPEAAYALAEDLRRRMAREVLTYGEHRMTATISVGIASTASGRDDTPENLIGRADRALYDAKKQGRNCTIVAP